MEEDPALFCVSLCAKTIPSALAATSTNSTSPPSHHDAMSAFKAITSPSGWHHSRKPSSSSSASTWSITTPPQSGCSMSPSGGVPSLLLATRDSCSSHDSSSSGHCMKGCSDAAERTVVYVQTPTREGLSPSSPHAPPKTPTLLSAPPRPKRSPERDKIEAPAPRTSPSLSQDLLLPRPINIRAKSPSGDSVSTVTETASTPRAAFSRENADTPSHPPDHTMTPPLSDLDPGRRKRDSTQRRLSALRGLVASLDFNQHWAVSEQPETLCDEGEEESDVWAQRGLYGTYTSDRWESTSQPSLSPSMSLVHDVPPTRPRCRRGRDQSFSGSSGGNLTSPERRDPDISVRRDEDTSLRQISHSSLSRAVSSPTLRRSFQPRGLTDSTTSLPDPPRPVYRHRREIFDVAHSGYSRCFDPASPVTPNTPTCTWRSALPDEEAYSRILQACGAAEVKRQEIMWEMCETEESFVKSMRTVLRLFAIPLQTPQHGWIHGIPGRITQLFDALQFIVEAHEIIHAEQCEMPLGASVGRPRDLLDTFRSRLVENNVRDKDSVFGEFVRMQMKEEVLGSMTLSSMLLKPVQRLTKYPLFLRRLLEVTPHPHPCHPAILSLLSTTDTLVLNLQAAKAKEDDLEQLRTLEETLHGLPEGFTLAVRGRKLLAQGLVVRVSPQSNPPLSSSGSRTSSLSSRGSFSSTVSSTYSSPWDNGGWTPSTARTSAFSVSSSASSYCPPSRSSSLVQKSPFLASTSRSPSSASMSADPRPHTSSSLRGLKRKEDVLMMLVFNDMMLVATDLSGKTGLFSGKRRTEQKLRVLRAEEGGIGKVAEVKDRGEWQGRSSLFSVTILPWDPSVVSEPITATFTLPSTSSSRPSKSVSTSCPRLTSVSQFLRVLGQTTTLLGYAADVHRGNERTEILQSTDRLVR